MLTVHYLTGGHVSSVQLFWILLDTNKQTIYYMDITDFWSWMLSFILEEWNIPVSILRVGLLLSLY